jgi:transcription antitermination factor NusG
MRHQRKASSRHASDLDRWRNLCNALAEDALPEKATGQWRLVTVGQRLIIQRGPLSGTEGVLLEIKSNPDRFRLSVDLPMRPLEVEIEADWARPVTEAPDSFLRDRTKRHSMPERDASKRGTKNDA